MNKKAIYSFLVAFVLLIAVVIIDRKAFNDMQDYVRSVDHSREVIIAFEKVSNYFKSAQIYSPAYAEKSKNPIYDQYKEEMDQLPAEIRHLKTLIRADHRQLMRLDSISLLISAHFQALKTKNIAELIDSGEGWRMNDVSTIHSIIRRGMAYEQDLLKTQEQELNKSTKLTRTLTPAFSIIAAILILATFGSNLFLTRKRKWLEGFLESVLDTSQGGIVTYKAVRRKGKIIDFKIEFANKAIGKLLGIKPSDVIGKNLRDMSSFVRETELMGKYIDVVETGRQQASEIYFDRNNVKRWFYVLLAKLGDGVLASFHDISELKQSQEELKRNIIKLEESNVELEQYAYAASHDLQEPLRKIRLYTSQLQRQMHRLDENGQRDIEKILSSAERMSNLITDLLGLSSVKKEAAFAPTDLSQIVKNVLDDLDLLISQKKVILEIAPLPVIEAIPLQMNQLFYNLLNNALKFASKEKQPTVRVTCRILHPTEIAAYERLNEELQHIEIVVADNGMGFNEEYAEQIFGLFKRLGDKQQYPGSGIGLALCKKVVDNHHGLIFAHGEENIGADFHIILPVSQKPI